jgi:hypothetical protein
MKKIIIRIIVLSFFILFLPQCGGNKQSRVTKSSEDVNKTSKVTTIERQINDVKIIVRQVKSLVESPNVPICKAEIMVSKNNILLDSLKFDAIEALGGCYGLIVYSPLIENHLIISKYGDYDGRTIVINEYGKIVSITGGNVYYDKESSLLFSIYDSDLSGFSIFDLKSDSVLVEMEDMSSRPIGFYKNSNLYYIQTIDDETEELEIWEVEFDLHRILNVEIELESIKDMILPGLTDYSKIEINCE